MSGEQFPDNVADFLELSHTRALPPITFGPEMWTDLGDIAAAADKTREQVVIERMIDWAINEGPDARRMLVQELFKIDAAAAEVKNKEDEF